MNNIDLLKTIIATHTNPEVWIPLYKAALLVDTEVYSQQVVVDFDVNADIIPAIINQLAERSGVRLRTIYKADDNVIAFGFEWGNPHADIDSFVQVEFVTVFQVKTIGNQVVIDSLSMNQDHAALPAEFIAQVTNEE